MGLVFIDAAVEAVIIGNAAAGLQSKYRAGGVSCLERAQRGCAKKCIGGAIVGQCADRLIPALTAEEDVFRFGVRGDVVYQREYRSQVRASAAVRRAIKNSTDGK